MNKAHLCQRKRQRGKCAIPAVQRQCGGICREHHALIATNHSATQPPPPPTRRDDDGSGAQPILPTLFMPGFPKAATSWLWECMRVAFTPELVCPPQAQPAGQGNRRESGWRERAKAETVVAFNESLWSTRGCGGRRFMLAAVSCDVVGRCSPRKELFLYGGGGQGDEMAQLASLHGPRLPLRLFQKRELRPGGLSVPQWEDVRLSRMNHFCTDPLHTRLPPGTLHPACCVAHPPAPRSSSAGRGAARSRMKLLSRRWRKGRGRASPTLGGSRRLSERPAGTAAAAAAAPPQQQQPPGGADDGGCAPPWQGNAAWHGLRRKHPERTTVTRMRTALPWSPPTAEGGSGGDGSGGRDTFSFATVDFTPNYLCSSAAMRNIRATAATPSALRFIVVTRDPIARAFSEWMMFAHGWGWDRERNLTRTMRRQMRELATCNATLHATPRLLLGLSDAALFRHLHRCFGRGKAMAYVSSSAYAVCIVAALRVFPREQFLFLKFEQLMAMKAPALLRLLSNFTGLFTDDAIAHTVRSRHRQCEAAAAIKKPLSFAKLKGAGTSEARRELEALRPELQRFFAPYEALLGELL